MTLTTIPAQPISDPHAIAFDNSFARELEGLYVAWSPAGSPAPTWLRWNHALAEELAMDSEAMQSDAGLALWSGNAVPESATPLAQVYAGHQFGHFSPQLGDGRALLLGELVDRKGQRRDLAFKGSGRTPFSRGGDGRAALMPVLREYLLGEAMHALAIPTTRVLAAVRTGTTVQRQSLHPGAMLTRVAASHIRVGTFEYFAAKGDTQALRRLADYSITRHDSALAQEPDRYLRFLEAVAERQAQLIARWMEVGFIHGVMNTDNMAISGETIDYGPCAMMEHYDPQTVFSSIDHHGRYAYGNQALIAQWNLTQFAKSLLPLIDEKQDAAVERASAVVQGFASRFEQHAAIRLHAKLGLAAAHPDDLSLAQDYLNLLYTHRIDYTLAFRYLADAAAGNAAPLERLFAVNTAGLTDLQAWLVRWSRSLPAGDAGQIAQTLRKTNPLYIARNHLVEAALLAAEQGDLAPFEKLLSVLENPFDERPHLSSFAEPARDEVTTSYQTFCGT